MNLSGKTALVTGGTDGIGRELARALRARGAAVIVHGRDPGRLAAAAADGFETIAADLSAPAGVEALADALADRPLDILVNNAGAGVAFDVSAPIDLEAVDRCIFLNLHAPIRLAARLLPALRARPEAMIVNVTSGLAIAPRAGSPVYCATKAGLRSFSMTLRQQLRGSGVHVLEALPPLVDTAMTASNTRHAKMSAADCAGAIVTAMERGRDEANVGATSWLRRLYSLSPALARRLMLRY